MPVPIPTLPYKCIEVEEAGTVLHAEPRPIDKPLLELPPVIACCPLNEIKEWPAPPSDPKPTPSTPPALVIKAKLLFEVLNFELLVPLSTSKTPPKLALSLNVAAPASDISKVRAVIIDPPSLPLNTISSSLIFEVNIASVET